jgi:hypothetical protein
MAKLGRQGALTLDDVFVLNSITNKLSIEIYCDETVTITTEKNRVPFIWTPCSLPFLEISRENSYGRS